MLNNTPTFITSYWLFKNPFNPPLFIDTKKRHIKLYAFKFK